MLEVPPRIELG